MKTIEVVEKVGSRELKAIILNIPPVPTSSSGGLSATITCWENQAMGDNAFRFKIFDPENKFMQDLEIVRSVLKPFFKICRDQFRLQRDGRSPGVTLWRDVSCSSTDPDLQEKPVSGTSFEENLSWLYPKCFIDGNICAAHNIKGFMPDFGAHFTDSDGNTYGTVTLKPILGQFAVDHPGFESDWDLGEWNGRRNWEMGDFNPWMWNLQQMAKSKL